MIFKSDEAKAFWIATKKEQQALDDHLCPKGIDRVDQIWPWLKDNHGQIMAVNAPHSLPPEKYTYKELANSISAAARAFHSLGVGQD